MENKQKEEILSKLTTELKLKGLSSKTIDVYSFFISKYLDNLENSNKNLNESKEQDVKNFLASLIDNYSNTSRALATSSLRFLYKEILEKPEIIARIKNPKKEQYLPNILAKQEIQQLINSAPTLKSRLIISFLYSTGVRVSELVNIKVNDLNLENNKGTVKGKGNKQRQIFLSEKLCKKLNRYLWKNKENKFLFSREKPLTSRNIQKIIKKAAVKSGLQKKVTPHVLRHSFATHHLESGTDIRKIQVLLGHARIDTTQIYTKVSSKELEELKNPLEDLKI
jgi:site-specific recombinase XerD